MRTAMDESSFSGTRLSQCSVSPSPAASAAIGIDACADFDRKELVFRVVTVNPVTGFERSTNQKGSSRGSIDSVFMVGIVDTAGSIAVVDVDDDDDDELL